MSDVNDLLREATEELRRERDRLRRFAEWVAAHKLADGTYADEEHPYDEWIAPDESEMDFGEIHQRAMEALGHA